MRIVCQQIILMKHHALFVNFEKKNPQKTANFEIVVWGAQWLSGRVLDLRLRGRRFEPHRQHCVVSLSKTHLS